MTRKISSLDFQRLDFRKLATFLKKHNISPYKARRIIERAESIKGNRTETEHWKMIRFKMYIWDRVIQMRNSKRVAKDGKATIQLKLDKRIDTVRRVVKGDRYKYLYCTFFEEKTFDPDSEIKKLNQLIAEPRQDHCFKEGLYEYPPGGTIHHDTFLRKPKKGFRWVRYRGSNTIPQDILDILR